jgi:hypothetical protein
LAGVPVMVTVPSLLSANLTPLTAPARFWE